MAQAASVDHPVWQDVPTRPFQLVLEGGAMRGLFTAGVLDFFLDHGLLAESVVGTSMGAICGYNYACGATGRMAYINMKYRNDWRFISLKSKVKTGDLVGSEFIYETIPHDLEGIDSGWFTDSPVELVSVATNIETGGADYHTFGKCGDVDRGTRYLMATTAMPFANKPVEVDGKRLIDGGAADSIPVEYGRPRYHGRQVLVLTRPRGFVQDEADWTIPAAHVRYARYPRLVSALEARPRTYNEQNRAIERMHDAGEVFAIWPGPELDIGMDEKSEDRLMEAYECGLSTAAREWPKLLSFLNVA